MGFSVVRKWSDVGFQDAARRRGERHGTIIIERGFVDRKVGIRRSFDGKRRMDGVIDGVSVGFLVVIFVAVGLKGGDAPGE